MSKKRNKSLFIKYPIVPKYCFMFRFRHTGTFKGITFDEKGKFQHYLTEKYYSYNDALRLMQDYVGRGGHVYEYDIWEDIDFESMVPNIHSLKNEPIEALHRPCIQLDSTIMLSN